MPSSFLPLGDVEGAAIAYLNTVSIPNDPQFSTDLVGWVEDSMRVTLLRSGGNPLHSEQVLYRRDVRLQVDVYGPDRESTAAVGEAVLGAMFALNQVPFAAPAAGVNLDNCDVEMDLSWLPDPKTLKPRWVSTVILGCRPLPVSST